MDVNRDDTVLASGKIPPGLLAEILALPGMFHGDLVVPPAPGEDGAVLHWPGGLVVIAGDPITFPTPRPGHFAVCVNANDIAVMGARPRFFTLTLLLPPGVERGRVLAIMRDVLLTANDLEIVLIGGHTEVTAAVCRPVLAVTMFGALVADGPLRTGGAKSGDCIIQVNPLAIEGTAILAADHREELSVALGADAPRAGEALLDSPGILVLEPALILAREPGVHALHDPTEGGIVTGLREMAEAASLGLRIHRRALLVRSITTAICACVGVDPVGLISSGCLLAAVDPAAADACVRLLVERGHEAAVIGEFGAPDKYVWVDGDGLERPLPRFAVDELAGE